MIDKNFQNFFSNVGSPKFNFRQKLNLHGVAYDLERLFKNFSDIFGQPIFRKC